jgi:hypothetical protein
MSDQSLCSPSSIDKTVNTKVSYSYNRWTFIFFLFGLINILSASWMLIAPKHWYYTLPAVPESGPLNIHFVRDIGCIFLLVYFPALLTFGLNIVLIRKYMASSKPKIRQIRARQ